MGASQDNTAALGFNSIQHWDHKITQAINGDKNETSCVCGSNYQRFKYIRPWKEKPYQWWLKPPMQLIKRIAAATRKHPEGYCSQGNHNCFTHNKTLAHAYDFTLRQGTPVTAARSGVVVDYCHHFRKGGLDPTLKSKANYIVLRHRDGKSYARYFHLKAGSVQVKLGAHVEQGAVIALSGNTGYTGGPHLHFDVVDCYPTEICRLWLNQDEKSYPCTLSLSCAPPAISKPQITLRLVVADPLDAAMPLRYSVTGCAVICARGRCDFWEKAENAKKAGAKLVIVYNDDQEMRHTVPVIGKFDPNIPEGSSSIPILFVSYETGMEFVAAASTEQRATVRFSRHEHFRLQGVSKECRETVEGLEEVSTMSVFQPLTLPIRFSEDAKVVI